MRGGRVTRAGDDLRGERPVESRPKDARAPKSRPPKLCHTESQMRLPTRLNLLLTSLRQTDAMRHLVDPVYRFSYIAGFRSARLLWGLTRPAHAGALVAITVGDRLMLVRQSYRRQLSLPGGGISPGEEASVAASRELREELALDVPVAALRLAHVETGLWDGRRDTVSFFELALDAPPPVRIDNREIVEARFVPIAGIDPATVTAPVAAYLAWRRRRLC